MDVNNLYGSLTSSTGFYSSAGFYPNYASANCLTTNAIIATPGNLSQQTENNSELKINIKKNPIKFNFVL